MDKVEVGQQRRQLRCGEQPGVTTTPTAILTIRNSATRLTTCLTAYQASAYYHVQYGAQKQWETTVGIIYTAKSGSPYTLYYYGDMNGDGASGNDLLYIPTKDQLNVMKFEATSFSNNALTRSLFGPGTDTWTANGNAYPKTLTADMQRQLMEAWIEGDSYLSKHRGQFYKRYADNLPFEQHFDLHFGQKFSFKVAGQSTPGAYFRHPERRQPPQ